MRQTSTKSSKSESRKNNFTCHGKYHKPRMAQPLQKQKGESQQITLLARICRCHQDERSMDKEDDSSSTSKRLENPS